MIRKYFAYFMLLLFLFGCSVVNSSTDDSSSTNNNSSGTMSDSQSVSSNTHTSSSVTVSSGQSSSNSSDSSYTCTQNCWSTVVNDLMQSMLGEAIPYITEFGANYKYATGYVDGSSIPYINPYIENGSNWTSKYATALLAANYLFDDTDTEDGVTWQNYYKTVTGGEILVRFSYYNNAGKNWFDIYAYLEGTRSTDIPIPTDADAIIVPSLFQSKGYPTSKTTITVNSISFTYLDVMNQASTVQFKNNTGYLHNTTSMNNLKYLYLENVDYFTRVAVQGGNSLTSLSTLTSYNGVYDLRGMSYFKIISTNTGVVKMDSIQLVLL